MEGALDEGLDGNSDTSAFPSATPGNDSQLRAKLGAVEALLKAEAESVAGSARAGNVAELEQAGLQAEKAMEAFLGGGGERGGGHDLRPGSGGAELGDDEERLLQMVSTYCLPAASIC